MDHVDDKNQGDKENPLVGQSLGRYKILSLMGKGGMGAVYKGRDETLKRDVAVKVMSAQLARQANFQERFLQEARTVARLSPLACSSER